MIAISLIGASVLACVGRPFDDEGFGEDEVDTSESSTSESSTSEGSTSESSSDTTEGPDTFESDESLDDGPSDWEEDLDFGEESTSESTSEESTEESTDGDDLPDGNTCTRDSECESNNCYVVPFLGGQCGECNDDSDCNEGGCSPPNPFEANGSFCNQGELGGGCESTEVCMPGLVCGGVLDLLGLIQINSCSTCLMDADCNDGQLCAPLVDVSEWAGYRDCIDPGSLPQDSFCELEGNGDQACASGICSTIDIMGLAELGACGECNGDQDCGVGTCVAGEFILDNGTLVGSTCQP